MTDTIPWEGVVALLDTPTNDGRSEISSEGFTTRDLPIPLRSILHSPHDYGGHAGARCIGTVNQIAIIGKELHARGRMDSDTQEAKYLLGTGARKYLSPAVDIAPPSTLMAVTLVELPVWTADDFEHGVKPGLPPGLFVWFDIITDQRQHPLGAQ